MRPLFEKTRIVFIGLCLALGSGGWIWYHDLSSMDHAGRSVPEFTAYTDIQQRKQAFLDYLYPLVAKANLHILQDRRQLIDIERHLAHDHGLSRQQLLLLEKLALRYEIEFDASQPGEIIKRLLKRVDLVPVSLVLAQAANETAWGTSRFATEANNYFGQWCYRKGCGLVPGARRAGDNHEVKVFSSPEESITAYMRNINRNRAYAELRSLRVDLRQKHRPVTGQAMADGLGKYSARGDTYIRSIRSIIAANNLQDYTHRFYAELAAYPELRALVTLPEMQSLNTVDEP